MSGHACLVLRLAAPLQSWGGQTEFNRRETESEPSYSGVLGLLAAAQGRRRDDPLVDLLDLRLGVRTDQAGTLLRDYHTVSDPEDLPLRTTKVNAKGQQLRPSGKKPKYTAVTERFYLQDAAFVAALEGPDDLLAALAAALRAPTFPLALGRRACPPAQPLIVSPPEAGKDVWDGALEDVVGAVPWQAAHHERHRHAGPMVRLPATLDDPTGAELRTDVPTTFDHKHRAYATRRVTRRFVEVATGLDDDRDPDHRHDPFALLGW